MLLRKFIYLVIHLFLHTRSKPQYFLYFHYDAFRLGKPASLCCVLRVKMCLRSLSTLFTYKSSFSMQYLYLLPLYLTVSVRSCHISAWLAGSVRGVCQGVGAASDLSDNQHTRQPPVTSSALTWHVKTPTLKAPQHPPAPTHLCLDDRQHTQIHTCLLPEYRRYHTIRPHKAIFTSLPSLWTQSHDSQTPLALALSAPLSSISPLVVTCKHTQWINLLGLD